MLWPLAPFFFLRAFRRLGVAVAPSLGSVKPSDTSALVKLLPSDKWVDEAAAGWFADGATELG